MLMIWPIGVPLFYSSALYRDRFLLSKLQRDAARSAAIEQEEKSRRRARDGLVGGVIGSSSMPCV